MAEGRSDSSDKADSINILRPASEEELHLAVQARNEFEKKNYDACTNTLNKLAQKRGQMDIKVAHNKAVVDYHRSGCTKTEEYKKTLADICTKAQLPVDLARGVEDVDQCVVYFNHAIIFYHLRQYRAALVAIDKLSQFIEPMDDGVGKRAMFLLAELYLCTHQPEKAMGMLNLLEKSFINGKGSEKENNNSSQEAIDALRPRISQYKTRCYLMLKSLKSCKRELKSLTNTVGTNVPVVYLRSNFEFLRGNCRKAIKLLNSAPHPMKTIPGSSECLPVMYYNNLGVIHFHMWKHHLGALYFRKAMQENQQATKHLNKIDPVKSLSGRPIHSLGVSRHYELLYNMGIQQLHCGRAQAAFDCLIETVQQYQVNPRLWLRLAECCIMAYKANNDVDRQLESHLKVVQGAEGTGIHRKLLLGTGLNKDIVKSESAAMPAMTLEFGALCLRNALMMLPEDPVATSAEDKEEEKTDLKSGSDSILVPAPPGNPMKGGEVANLRCSILAASAYIALCLNDHLMALDYAEKLLKQPRLSGAHKYLAHMYIAEAQVVLDRIADAVSHLDPDTVTDVSTTFPELKSEQDKNGERDPQEQIDTKASLSHWSPWDVPHAKALMQYNLATAHAIRGQYEEALHFLGQSTQTVGVPLPAQMYFLKLYLELMEGHKKMAQAIINEHFGHVTRSTTA